MSGQRNRQRKKRGDVRQGNKDRREVMSGKETKTEQR